MTKPSTDDLLARLARGNADGPNPWESVVTTAPEPEVIGASADADPKLDALPARIAQLASPTAGPPAAREPHPKQPPIPSRPQAAGAGQSAPTAAAPPGLGPGPLDPETQTTFVPLEPKSLAGAGLTESEVE